MSKCNHIYVVEREEPLPNDRRMVYYRCGTCGDSFSNEEGQ